MSKFKWADFLNGILSISSTSILNVVISTLTSVDRYYRTEAKVWRVAITFGPPLLFTLIQALSLKQVAPLLLSETQIMYSFSAMSQVIAAVLGLTLTASVFFNQRIEKISQRDKEFVEVYDDIKSINHFFLACISIISVISIIMCFISIYFYGQESILVSVHKFLLNETLFLSVFSICLIIFYGVDLFNDNRVNKMLIATKKILENHFNVDMATEQSKHGDLATFLGMYNDLEKLILKRSNEDYKKYSVLEQMHQDFFTGLKVLVSNEKIPAELAKRILNIRRYRNALVHGNNFFVAMEIQQELRDILEIVREQLKN